MMRLLGRATSERIAALSRYPDRARMPGELLQRLALALAEDGRADEAKALLSGRFFAREEGGTNVRQVFVEIRLLEALALARGGRGPDALAIVEGLGREAPGFAFTKDGMDVRDAPRTQYAAGEIASLAGDDVAARRHWQKATEGRRPSSAPCPMPTRPRGSVPRGGLARAWNRACPSRTSFSNRAGVSGVVVTSRGLMLRALGREDEARPASAPLMLPDQRLSHLVSRRASGAKPF